MKSELNKKCVLLYSGGLDSLLSTMIVKSLGLDVFPLLVKTPFYSTNEEKIKKQLKQQTGLDLETTEDKDAYIEFLKNPKFKSMNNRATQVSQLRDS